MMRWELLSATDSVPVTASEVYAALGLDPGWLPAEQVALLDTYLAAAVGAAEALQGRDLQLKRWRVAVTGPIASPVLALRGPIRSVTAYRADGSLDGSEFDVSVLGESFVIPSAGVWPAYDDSSPWSYRFELETGLDTYDAWWSEAGRIVKAGIIQLAAHLWMARGSDQNPIPDGIARMLAFTGRVFL